jgi:outer membrane protein
MIKKRLILTINTFLLAVPLIFSQQQALTYEQAIGIAVEKNITIKQQKNLLKGSLAEKQQSMASFLPSLNADAGGARTVGQQWSNEESAMINSSVDRASYGIDARLNVFNGFSKIYRLKQTSQLHEAQKYQVEQSTQDITFQVSNQFLQILLDQELLKIAEEDFRVQNELYNQIEAFTKVGTKSKSDLLSQKVQLNSSEIAIITRQNLLRTDKANLAKILLLDPKVELELLTPNWSVDSIMLIQYSLDSLMGVAKVNRPDIKRLEFEEKASLQGVRISQANYMPSVSIYYSYGSYFASNNTRMDPIDSLSRTISFEEQMFRENYSHQYGFTISIPIFNRLQTRTKVVHSKIAYENSTLDYQDFVRQLFLDVQKAYQDFTSYKQSYLANVTNVEASQMAYQKQFELYKLGQGSLVELNLESQRNILAQSEKVQAEYTLLFQQIILDYYCGILKL